MRVKTPLLLAAPAITFLPPAMAGDLLTTTSSCCPSARTLPAVIGRRPTSAHYYSDQAAGRLLHGGGGRAAATKAKGQDDDHSNQDSHRPRSLSMLTKLTGGSRSRAPGVPSALQLFKHLYSDILLSPTCKDLFVTDIIVHILSCATVITLGWLRFVFPALLHITFKVYFVGLLSIVVVLTEVTSAFMNAAILLRLSGQASPSEGIINTLKPLLNRRWRQLLVLAAVASIIRIIVEASNNLISPILGSVLLPFIVKRYSTKRKHVGFVDSMDMSMTTMLMENLGFRRGRQRAIDYYVHDWGWLPSRTVRVDDVFITIGMTIILGVAVPLMSYGNARKDKVILAWGYTALVIAFTLIQLLRPLAANVYSLAAYRHTVLKKNDVWTKYPALAPNAYQSSHPPTKEEKAEIRKKKDS